MSAGPTEFMFRVWLRPEEGAEVEVWWHGLESHESGKRFVSEWISGSFSEEDFYDLFKLDENKHWQIIGKATIKGHYNYFGDYDENIDVLESSYVEMKGGEGTRDRIIERAQDALKHIVELERLEAENADLREILKRYAHGTYKTCQCSSCRALRAEEGGGA